MNGAALRNYLTHAKFDFDKDLDAWVGPTGLIISDTFIMDMDDFHTSHAIEQIVQAVERGARHVMARVVSTKPTRIKVEWK